MQVNSNVGKTHEARCIQLSGFDLTHFFYLSVLLICRTLRDLQNVSLPSNLLCYGRIRTLNRSLVFLHIAVYGCIQSLGDMTWLVIILMSLEVAKVIC